MIDVCSQERILNDDLIMVSKLSGIELTMGLVYAILYYGLTESSGKADYGLVLGSSKAHVYKVPAAMKLYNEGRVSKLIFSGGNTIKDINGNFIKESEIMRQKWLELGMSEKALILESNSKYTYQNFIESLKIISYDKNKIYKLYVITNEYHMRKSLGLAKKNVPSNFEILSYPVMDKGTNHNTWYKTKDGIERATSEALKIIDNINNGYIDDFEISRQKVKKCESLFEE